MKFLSALKLSKKQLSKAPNVDPLNIVCSITSTNFAIYLNAYANKENSNLVFQESDFGTLIQTIERLHVSKNNQSLLFLFPWDVQNISSWRDIPINKELSEKDLKTEIESLFLSIKKINSLSTHYFDFPLPSHQFPSNKLTLFRNKIVKFANTENCYIHGPEHFSLCSFLKTGNPFKQSSIDNLARLIYSSTKINLEYKVRDSRKYKVLFTDLDNTFWQGVLAEDGYNFINSLENYNSKIHLHYRLLLRRLAQEGILVIAISRNDLSYVEEALKKGIKGFEYNLFTAILCGYGKKSNMAKELLNKINLNSSDAVFIDDNYLELLEIQSSIKDINLIQFSTDEEAFISLFNKLQRLFGSNSLTHEDRNRVDLYTNMLSFKDNLENIEKGKQLTSLDEYLNSLNMCLTISLINNEKDRKRAVQLINKTSQFNANGLTIDKISTQSQLIIGSLKDSTVDHGIIIACVISSSGLIDRLVMSCRVFQRGVEDYFLKTIIDSKAANEILIRETTKNRPFRSFLSKNSLGHIDFCKDLKSFKIDQLKISLPKHFIKIEKAKTNNLYDC